MPKIVLVTGAPGAGKSGRGLQCCAASALDPMWTLEAAPAQENP